MIKFTILIFGCQMNYADAARIRAVLTNCGFLYTETIETADIVIFDTCSVRQKAEDKITGKLKNIKPNQKIWITGCMIQHVLRQKKITKSDKPMMTIGNFLGPLDTQYPEVIGITSDEINNFSPGSSSFVPINHAFNPLFHKLTKKRNNIELMRRIDDTGFLPLILKKIGYHITYDRELINEYEKILPLGPTSMNTHQTTAYIPISTGCNQFCSYCIVPYARGLERYFSVEQIVKEAKIHIKNGAKEIVLLGQIVNKHPQFVTIIKEILKLQGLQRLRYTSPYPTYYTKELFILHEQEEKLCPHIHMPLQSGSDKILKKMFRGYTIKQAKEWIDTIRKLKREISITTDIIVGFPGETEADFKKTLALIHYGQFDMIYIGIYSPRPGTFAAQHYPDDVPRSVKQERRKRLNDLLIEISRKNNEKEVGKIKTVLINKINEGYTDNMKQIIIEGKRKIKEGEFIHAKITKGVPFTLYGEII